MGKVFWNKGLGPEFSCLFCSENLLARNQYELSIATVKVIGHTKWNFGCGNRFVAAEPSDSQVNRSSNGMPLSTKLIRRVNLSISERRNLFSDGPKESFPYSALISLDLARPDGRQNCFSGSEVRSLGRWSIMFMLVQDVLFAFRQLTRHRAYSLTAVLSLALGIGATAAVYSVLYGVLIDPYPYRDADRIAFITIQNRQGEGRDIPLTLAEVDELR